MSDVVLPALPRVAPRYAKASLAAVAALAALAAGSRREPVLSDRRLVVEGVRVDAPSLAAWARCVGDHLRDDVPAAYPAVLALPLAVALMVDHPFPLRLPGLVHVRQQIHQERPLQVGEAVELRVSAERLAAHPKGTSVDVVAQALADGEVVWTGTSTYLARGEPLAGLADGGDEAVGSLDALADHPGSALWRVRSDTGRRFAALSGDVNPIHLSALSARAFGFPRAIAHGQWTLARALASVSTGRQVPVDVDAVFRRPLLLPSRVELVTRPVTGPVSGRSGAGWDLAVRPAGVRDERRVHLLACVRTSIPSS